MSDDCYHTEFYIQRISSIVTAVKASEILYQNTNPPKGKLQSFEENVEFKIWALLLIDVEFAEGSLDSK